MLQRSSAHRISHAIHLVDNLQNWWATVGEEAFIIGSIFLRVTIIIEYVMREEERLVSGTVRLRIFQES